MELNKFPLNYYIMQTSDLDSTRLLPGGSLSTKMSSYQYILSLTWESSYLGKTVFTLRPVPGISIVGTQDGSSLGPLGKASQAKFVSCGMEHCPLVMYVATPAH